MCHGSFFVGGKREGERGKRRARPDLYGRHIKNRRRKRHLRRINASTHPRINASPAAGAVQNSLEKF
jgi:hypothetical protein